MWLKSPNISSTHGFSTRYGGISPAPFDALNLGGSEDIPENILQNRILALASLGYVISDLCYLKQVHGSNVCIAQPGIQEGDALVTREPGKILAVSAADCYPVLFEDSKNGVIGAAHAGWRGTVARIVANTIHSMCELGAEKKHIQVAIGQGISVQHFETGDEVREHFLNKGFPASCIQHRHIDLLNANRFVAMECGIPSESIFSLNRCTFESDFFSHRRDKGKTGRMWGVIGLAKD
jgi:polyphenol oxidase